MRTEAIETPELCGVQDPLPVHTIIGTNLALNLVRKFLSDAAGAVIGK